ncbi:MAG: glycosyltransferase family 4 protein [Patescibacteria group bacterium]
MRIGIDARCLQEGRNTGVEEYARGLIKRLAASYPKDQLILFVNSFGAVKEDFGWLGEVDNIEIKTFKIPNKLLNLSFWLFDFPRVDKMIGGTDVFFVPNFCFISLSRNCKKVLTVHDLSFEWMPETFSLKRRLWHFFVNPRRMCRRFDRILAVSDSTKQDLKSLYGINLQKIEVKQPFFDNAFLERYNRNNFREKDITRVCNKYNLPRNYILFLGTIEPRKNINALIQAFDYWKQSHKSNDLKLVIAGQRGWLYEKIFQEANKSDFKEEIIFTEFIEEEDKPFVYAGAWLFVFPSLFEGFGFPPLEAMASGVPVIASNHSSIPEVLGDEAILINPYRSYEIYLAINILLKDKKMYNKYQEEGLNRVAKLFSKANEEKIELENF